MKASLILCAFVKPKVHGKQTDEGVVLGNVKLTLDVGDLKGKDAAEQVFNLTNNPAHAEWLRKDENGPKYEGPSASVGDMVVVEDDNETCHVFFCDRWGWLELALEDAAKILRHEAQGKAPDDRSLRFGFRNRGRGDANMGYAWLAEQGVVPAREDAAD